MPILIPPCRPASRRDFLRVATILSIMPFFAACERARPLRVAVHKWPGYELLFLARSEGWLEADRVLLQETGSASESMAALRAGQVEAAALTLDEMLRLRAEGMALTAVLVFDVSLGADVVFARQPIQSLGELAGKTIALERSALGALMLTRLLEAAGLRREEVKLVQVAFDGHLAAWQRKEIDVLITFEPVASQLEARGAVRIFDSRAIPGCIFDVLAVRREAMKAYAAPLRHLLQGYFRAQEHLRHNQTDAIYRMAGHQGLSADGLSAAYRGIELPPLEANRRYLSGRNDRLIQTARELSRIMQREGIVARGDDLAAFVDAAYLPAGEE